MDILIIGAGAAGLAAGQSLRKAGHDVQILEARDRIGGRVWTDRALAGIPVERGAEFIHGDRTCTWELIPGGKKDAIFTGAYKDFTYEYGNILLTCAELCAQPGFPEIFSLESGLFRQTSLPEHDQSLADWTRSLHLPQKAAEFFMRYLAHIYTAEPEDIGILDLIHEEHVHHAGENDYRPREGYDHIIRRLAADLPVRLSTAVTDVRWKEGSVKVTTAQGDRLEAEKLIVTVPVSLLQQDIIRFSPALPDATLTAIHQLKMGPALKMHFLFSEIFWDPRTRGFVGEHDVFFWELPGCDREGAPPVITAFLTGKAAQAYSTLSDEEICERCLTALCGLFHSEQPRQSFSQALRSDWINDPWTRGGYSYVPTGAFGAREALARPIENTLYFAGEAAVFMSNPSTVHGAIESGRWAAEQMIG